MPAPGQAEVPVPAEGAKPQAESTATPPAPAPAPPTRTVTVATAPTTRTTAPAPATTTATPTMPATSITIEPASRSGRRAGVYVAADADNATRLRDWPISVVYYQNGNVIAGPVYRWIPAEPKTDRYGDLIFHEAATTALSLPQFLAAPLWMFITPPWRAIEYHGEEVPPSYTVDEKVPYYKKEKVPAIWVIGE
jgi:hypothetical protein